MDEGIDSEEEEDEDEDEDDNVIASHIRSGNSLYDIKQQLNDYTRWLRNEMIVFLAELIPDTKKFYIISELIWWALIKGSWVISWNVSCNAIRWDDDENENNEKT